MRLRPRLLPFVRVWQGLTAGQESGVPFIQPGDEEAFEKPGWRIPRRVMRVDAPKSERDSRWLEVAATEKLRELRTAMRDEGGEESGYRAQLRLIRARDGDGMSWAAAMVSERVAELEPKLERIHLAGDWEKGDVPKVMELVPRRAVARLARKYGISKKFQLVSVWSTVGVVAAYIAVGTVGLVFADKLGVLSSLHVSGLAMPWRIALLMVSAAVPLVSKLLLDNVRLGDMAPDVTNLSAEIWEHQKSDNFTGFADAIAELLETYHIPRFVIVDRFDGLDPLTKKVILKYLDVHAPSGWGYERWVIFETEGGPDLWNEAFNKSSGGYAEKALYDLRPLTPAERTDLAERIGHPKRADLDTVRAICRPEDDARLQEFFVTKKEAQAGSRTRDLDLFYLLALTFARGRRPTLTSADIVRDFEYTGTQEPKLDVLRKLLHGARLSKPQLGHWLTDVLAGFEAYIKVKEERLGPIGFDINVEVGRWLEDHWQEFGLKRPALGHLFWALYWQTQLKKPGGAPAWVDARKVAEHVKLGDSRVLLDEGVPDAVVDALIEAASDSASSCLGSSAHDLIPGVLITATQLVAIPRKTKRYGEASLVPLCWRAYSIIGDEAILRTISDLLRQTTSSEPPLPRAPDLGRALEELFLQSIGLPSDERLLKPASAGVHGYARSRSLWLLAALRPFRTLAPNLSTASAQAATVDLLASVRSVIERLEATGSDTLAVDYLSLSVFLWYLTLWCAERGFQLAKEAFDATAEILERALAQVHALRARQTSPGHDAGGNVDLLGLASELALLVAVPAALLLRNESLTKGDAKRIRTLCGNAIGEAGLASDIDAASVTQLSVPLLLKTIEDQLGVVQVMWDTIRFSQFSSFAVLRRAELYALIHPGDNLERKVGEMLAPALVNPQPDAGDGQVSAALQMMAHLILANASRHEEIAARHVCTAVKAAIDGELPDPLLAELCLLAVERAHSFKQPLDMFLRHLVTPRHGMGMPLEGLLRSVPDAGLQAIALQLLQAGELAENAGYLKAVLDCLRQRAALADPRAAADVAEEIALSELKSNLRPNPDADAILDDWADKRSSRNYPMVLHMLMNKLDAIPERVLSEVLLQLSTPPDKVVRSSWILMAETATRKVRGGDATPGSANLPAKVVTGSIRFLNELLPIWVNLLDVDTSFDIAALLVNQGGPANATNRGLLDLCLINRLKRDSMSKLPTQIRGGLHFLMLQDVFRTLSALGLVKTMASASAAEYSERTRVSDSDKRQAAEPWRKTGAPALQALIAKEGENVLNIDFLVIGNFLFSPPLVGEEVFDDARAKFNKAARPAVQATYDRLINAKSLPAGLKAVLQADLQQIEAV